MGCSITEIRGKIAELWISNGTDVRDFWIVLAKNMHRYTIPLLPKERVFMVECCSFGGPEIFQTAWY